MRYILSIVVFWCAFSVSIQSAEVAYRTKVLTPETVKTLRMRYVDSRTMEPIGGNPVRPFLVKPIGEELGGEGDTQQHLLEISFDELSHETHQYTYTLLHLNADGTQSGLNSSEYVAGFTTQDITEYEHSLNTSQLYTHYSFVFPNEDMRLTASGNYALKIYEDGDEDKTIAFVCFSVVEPTTTITAKVRPNTDIEINKRYQQLDIDISRQLSAVSGQMTEYFIVVRQNGRYDNQAYAPKPNFIESNKLRFTNCKALIFEGGNEYRHFDTYSNYFAGTGVDRITHDRNDYHALLFAEPFRTGAYIHEYDVDGQWLVNAERTLYDIDTEAEYMWVHWTVPAPNPWFDGIVYVGGDLFENSLSPRNRMQYDNSRKCYWLNALVKQGGYDYQYWFVSSEDKKVTLQRTEGSHWETENEYTIYVYYRPFGSRADQLVGLQVLH